MNNKLRIPFVLAICTLGMSGCEECDLGRQTTYETTRSLDYARAVPKTLSVENTDGSVVVVGKPGSGVSIQMQIKVRHRDAATAARICETVQCLGKNEGGNVMLKTVVPPKYERYVSTSYIVSVPETAAIRIRNTNGRVTVEKLKNGAQLRTTNGEMEITDLRGPLVADTTNGAITLEEVRGNINASTTNGRIEASQTAGLLQLRTKNGRVSVRDVRSPEHPIVCSTTNSSISLERTSGAFELLTTNGAISVEADDLGKSGTLSRAETANGSIDVGVPRSLKIHVDASVSNGRVQNQLAQADPRKADHSLRLRTNNGSISVNETR